MYLKDAMNEYAFDCRIRKLSPRTLDNYTKQLRYFEEYLLENYGIDHIEEVKRAHIKHFMGMMDAKNRKPQYINDLLKVIKTFFRYAQKEEYMSLSKDMLIPSLLDILLTEVL